MQVRGSNTLSVAMLDNGNYQVADGEGEAQTMIETQLNARIANQVSKLSTVMSLSVASD